MGTLISRFIDNSMTVLDKPGKDYTILQRVQVNSKGTTLLERLTLEEGEGNCKNWIQRGITLFAVITKLALVKLLKVVLTSIVIMGLVALLLFMVAFQREWKRLSEGRSNTTYDVECGPVSFSGFLDLWTEKEIFVHGILFLVVLEACLALEGICKGEKLLNSKLPIVRVQPTPIWISGIVAVVILTPLFMIGAALGSFVDQLFHLSRKGVVETEEEGVIFTRRDFAEVVRASVREAFCVAVLVLFAEWIFSGTVFVLVQCFGGRGGGKRWRNNKSLKGNDLGWLRFGRIAGLTLSCFWLNEYLTHLIKSCGHN